MWFATLIVFLALLYVVFPLDFDFVPVVGRIDDLIIVILAAYYNWKKKKVIDAMAGAGPRRKGPGGERGRDPDAWVYGDGGDPYRLLGVDPGDDVALSYGLEQHRIPWGVSYGDVEDGAAVFHVDSDFAIDTN